MNTKLNGNSNRFKKEKWFLLENIFCFPCILHSSLRKVNAKELLTGVSIKLDVSDIIFDVELKICGILLQAELRALRTFL